MRLLAAAHALRERIGCLQPPAEQTAHDADLGSTREALSAEAFVAAWEQGKGMSLREAGAYAREGARPTPPTHIGLGEPHQGRTRHRLLAAEGLTNTEIGQRLFTSPRTAKAHLAHMFAKLGITSRKQLPRGGQPEAWTGFSRSPKPPSLQT